MEDGIKDLRARWIFTLAFCTSFQRGEGCNGRVRSEWGQIRWLVAICSVLDLYNCSRLVSGVQHPAILQEMVYILLNVSLFLTERFPHQQTRPNVITLFTNESWNTNTMFLCMCKALSILSKYTIFAGLSYIDSLYYHPTLVCH